MNTKTLPAPVRGWIENENLAANGALGCSVLENAFPLPSTVRVRGGHLPHAFVGAAVQTLLPYRTGADADLFAATENDLFDVTAGSTTGDAGNALWPGGSELWPGGSELWFGFGPANLGPIDPVLPGFGGRFSAVQMDTGAGPFLIAANGSDHWALYNGTDWNPVNTASVNKIAYDGLTADFVTGQTVTGGTSGATASILMVVRQSATTGILRLGAITGTFQNNEALTSTAGAAVANGVASLSSAVTVTGVVTSDLYPIWVHNNRLWGIEAGTMKAWFLPIDSIGGAAADFNLGTVFDEGGALYLGATWSSDSGSGMDDRCVFVSTEGEVAVYAGVDPADANAWGKVGTYKIARPVSTQTIKAGGDLLLLTEDGIVPMSAVISKDPVALAAAAVTANIEPAWRRLMDRNATSLPIQAMKWPKEGMILVGYPHASDEVHVANARTGAWAKWTGHDVQCMALHRGQAYFGDSEGYVSLFEAGGSDRGENYVMRLSLLPDHLGRPGAYKTVHKARATFRALAPFKPRMSVATNYRREFPTPPSAELASAAAALWDVGLWDVSRWDDAPESEQRETRVTRWKSVGRSGFAIAPQLQITCGSTRKPDAELVALDLLYEVGAVVV